MHKLTEKLGVAGTQITDKIIKQFLSECADEIDSCWKHPTPRTRQVLGLESEPKHYPKCDLTANPPIHHAGCDVWYEPKESKTWCEHLNDDGTVLTFDCGRRKECPNYYPHFCPICGKERPKKVEEKSLANKLTERIHGMVIDGVKIDKKWCYPLTDALAEIAEEHFTQNPKREQ